VTNLKSNIKSLIFVVKSKQFVMAALHSRCGHYIFWHVVSIFLSSSFFPRLISAVADWIVYHTSTHGVALVRIWNTGRKCAGRDSLEIHDAKNDAKIAIWAPSHNFVGLYLHN